LAKWQKKLKVQIIPRKKLCHTLGKVMAKWQKRFFSYTLIGALGKGKGKLCQVAKILPYRWQRKNPEILGSYDKFCHFAIGI